MQTFELISFLNVLIINIWYNIFVTHDNNEGKTYKYYYKLHFFFCLMGVQTFALKRDHINHLFTYDGPLLSHKLHLHLTHIHSSVEVL